MLNTLNFIYLFGNQHYVFCFNIMNNDIIQLKILVNYITRKYFYHFLFKRYSVDGCQNRKKDTMNIKNTNDVSQEINTYCYTVHSGSQILYTELELCSFQFRFRSIFEGQDIFAHHTGKGKYVFIFRE